MNLSRFFGSTNREALRQVRLALGPDALIVSNRRINGGVEILASDPTAPAGAVPRDAQTDEAPAGSMNVIDAIGEIRGAMETRFDELLWGNRLRGAPRAAQLFQTLLGLGFSTALLRAMLPRMDPGLSRASAMRWVRDELTSHLPVLRREGDLWRPGQVLALVGPTGVGKTTTIAKLAARCLKRIGADRLMLLTTDTYRIGATEQLRIYGDMMNLPVSVARDSGELARAVASAGPDRTILIDNVGMSQRDRCVSEQAALLAAAGRPVSRLLVLSASSHGDTLDEVARTYSGDGGGRLHGCIVTKIDEASRVAPVLDTAIRYRLPICYVANGQRVPEDLLYQSASELVDQALTHEHRCRDLYAPTEADFAMLMSMAEAGEPDGSRPASGRPGLRLPCLLAAAGAAPDARLEQDRLERAGAAVDALGACAEAYALWRTWPDGSADPDVTPVARHLMRVGASHHARTAGPYMPALHGSAELGCRGGRLRSAALFDSTLTAVAAPVQQLEYPHGWQSGWGDASAAAPRPGEALLRQIGWLEENGRGMPLVHLVGGAGAATLHALSDAGRVWLARCPARMRVERDLARFDLAGLANELDFHPVQKMGLRIPAGIFAGDAVVWAGVGAVSLPRRHGRPTPARAIVLRVVDGASGAALATISGLTNADPDRVSADMLADWLAALSQSKALFRHMAGAWRWLSAGAPPATPAMYKAVLAAQFGLAAWQAAADTELDRILSALDAGAPASGTVRLLKLFALKEMLESGGMPLGVVQPA